MSCMKLSLVNSNSSRGPTVERRSKADSAKAGAGAIVGAIRTNIHWRMGVVTRAGFADMKCHVE